MRGLETSKRIEKRETAHIGGLPLLIENLVVSCSGHRQKAVHAAVAGDGAVNAIFAGL